MKYFERLGRKSAPASPKSSRKAPAPPFYSKSNLALLRRKVTRAFVWPRVGANKKVPSPEVTCNATPETTSLIDLDCLSLGHDDSYLYKSASSESNENLGRRFETFPYWADDRVVVADEQSTSASETASEVKCVEERTTLLRRSLMAVIQRTRSRSNASTSYSRTVRESVDSDDDLEHFSISTEPQQQHCVTISVTVGDDDDLTPGYEPASDHSFSTKSSTSSQPLSLATRDESRVSLDQFMEEKQREAASIMTGPIALGDVDGASVGSACLDVAFDGDYPQLVLTPSHDGTSSRMTGCSTLHSHCTIGVSYPHPAPAISSRSVSSFDTARKNTSCTPRWLNDNIDRVWSQIDQSRSDVDATCRGGCYQSDTTMNDSTTEEEQKRVDEFIYRYSKHDGVSGEPGEVDSFESGIDVLDEDSLDDEEVPPPPPDPKKSDFDCDMDGFTWVQDMWTFSAEETALSLSNRIEKSVIDPILKPICLFVETTEIPDSIECGSKYRRPPLNRNANSSYYMAPCIVTHA